MAIPVTSQIYNPVTGVFGTGQMLIFPASGSWTVPNGINKCRARLWGAGSSTGGGGGGFALKTIWDLTGVIAVPVTVGAGTASGTAGTSSFGSYVSATGGTSGGAGGTGVGGDINYAGGAGSSGNGGGGSASLFGNGGAGVGSDNGFNGNGGAGGGNNNSSYTGGNGFLGRGGVGGASAEFSIFLPSTGMNMFSIDFIGCGGGGSLGFAQNGINGGGGAGGNGRGGIPGGGSAASASYVGANGLVIVEW